MRDRGNILIVCGQGTYAAGAFHCEHPDRDVYLMHAMTVRDIVRQFAYGLVVCSGGYTQKVTPRLSEAESFGAIWNDTATRPDLPPEAIVIDDRSLDSAENVCLGLMAARLHLGEAHPIRRIGVFTAWRFKKPRFTMLSHGLGIDSRFYFHGFADAQAAADPKAAASGEATQMKSMTAANDALQLSPEWVAKRQHRYAGNDFTGRLTDLRSKFPAFFAATDAIATGGMSEHRSLQLRVEMAKIISGDNRIPPLKISRSSKS